MSLGRRRRAAPRSPRASPARPGPAFPDSDAGSPTTMRSASFSRAAARIASWSPLRGRPSARGPRAATRACRRGRRGRGRSGGCRDRPRGCGSLARSLRPPSASFRARASASSRRGDVLAAALHEVRVLARPAAERLGHRAADRGRRDALLDQVLAHRDRDRGLLAVRATRRAIATTPEPSASRAASVMRRRSSPREPVAPDDDHAVAALRRRGRPRRRPPASSAAPLSSSPSAFTWASSRSIRSGTSAGADVEQPGRGRGAAPLRRARGRARPRR